MEILFTEPIDLERVADLCAMGLFGPQHSVSPRDRAKWHVSNLLQSASHIARGDTRYHEFEGHPSGIMSMGRIWEVVADCYLSWWVRIHGGSYIPDQERETDGIIGSLDGLMVLPDYGLLVSETKLRFTQNVEDVPLSHIQQMQAYCHLVGTNLVCYVSGHISSAPPTAVACLRLIRFTPQSIEETWRMLVSTKRYLEGQGCCPTG